MFHHVRVGKPARAVCGPGRVPNHRRPALPHRRPTCHLTTKSLHRSRPSLRSTSAWAAWTRPGLLPGSGRTRGWPSCSLQFAGSGWPAAQSAFMPASTTNFSPRPLRCAFGGHRFRTTVTRSGSQVFLVGGGDPAVTTFSTPAISADASLVRLASDSRAWCVIPVSPRCGCAPRRHTPVPRRGRFLEVRPGHRCGRADHCAVRRRRRLNPPASPRSPNPPLTAAQSFARLLQQRDIQVLGRPHRHLPPVTRWRRSNPPAGGSGRTPPTHLRQHRSRHPGSPGRPGGAGRSTFAGGARATLQVLAELGIDTSGIVLNDGSGLSRGNRISPERLIDVLRAAVETDRSSCGRSTPVCQWPGSTVPWPHGSALPVRVRPEERSPTGPEPLTGTSTLAGFVSDRDGQLLMYAVMTNDVNTFGVPSHRRCVGAGGRVPLCRYDGGLILRNPRRRPCAVHLHSAHWAVGLRPTLLRVLAVLDARIVRLFALQGLFHLRLMSSLSAI